MKRERLREEKRRGNYCHELVREYLGFYCTRADLLLFISVELCRRKVLRVLHIRYVLTLTR